MTSQALGGHLHFSLKEVELTKSVTAAFTFVSATVTSCSVVLLCDSTIGRLCHAIPIVSGPIDTECWNTRDSYNDSRRVHPEYQREGEDSRLLEFFTALPNQNHAGNIHSYSRSHDLEPITYLKSGHVIAHYIA